MPYVYNTITDISHLAVTNLSISVDPSIYVLHQSMKVKLQPPSATDLAPFNPILPPASITQIMLLANPAKVGDNNHVTEIHKVPRNTEAESSLWKSVCLQERVRLRYKLAFTLGECVCNEVGEVDQFPPPETWGHL